MSRPKLLLADDSVTIRKVVELTFADEGIDVSTVGDAQSAMSRFVEIQPDIVLIDVGLDGTSGYQICEMIKADDATRHIPVLLLVGSFEPFDQDEAERVGADGFLTKPFHSIRDLVARVSDLLGSQAPVPETAPVTVGTSGAEHSLEHLPNDAFSEPVEPDTADIENLYRSSFADTVEIDEYDTVDDMLGDAALDDEMIEASYPTEAYTHDLNGLIPQVDDPEQMKEFDWSPESIVAEKPAAAGFEPKFVFDESDEIAVEQLEHVVDAESGPAIAEEPETSESEAQIGDVPTSEIDVAESQNEPSPELVSMIARSVIEKLSDRVIREIAREAVPRIAEKLIREALDDTGKKA